MSLNAAALRLMEEKGLSLSDVVEIAAAMESRTKAAERQAKYRRNKKARDVTDDDVTRDVTPAPKKRSKTPAVSDKSKTAKGDPFVLPDWVPAEPWKAFEAMRKAMRSVPFTDAAKHGIVRELEELRSQGHDPAKLLLKAVKKGWRSLFGGEDTLCKGAGTARPMTADELRRGIKRAEDFDDPERAAELRRELDALVSSSDFKVTQLVREAGERLRA